LCDSCKTRGALAVDSVDDGSVRNASVEGCRTSCRGSAVRWEDVSNGNILDELRIEVYARIDQAEDMEEYKIGFGVLETALVIAERMAETITTSSSCCLRRH
jgi:hypothetical protein